MAMRVTFPAVIVIMLVGWITLLSWVLLQHPRAVQAVPKSYADEVYELQAKMGVGHQDVIHRPRSGCPAGYALVPRLFGRGEETFDACARDRHASTANEPGSFHASGDFDFLLPHEGVSMSVILRMPEAPSGKRI